MGHIVIDLTVVALYTINAATRMGTSSVVSGMWTVHVHMLMSVLGIALLVVAGWAGGRWSRRKAFA